MKLAEERHIAADPATVWAAVLDAEVLKQCVPGCESLTGNPTDGFEAVVTQKVGPVKARFTGVVTLSDMVEGKSLRITGEGKGGVAGFAKGGAYVTMEPEGDGTKLTYDVEASVGGKIAQLGSRIIDGFAKNLAEEFFNRFQNAIEAPAEEPEAESGTETAADDATETPKKGWFRRLIG
ncbi:carbon monoxide dehydrogenase [bacterium]|nr:carbon monoxide dehydrogenase [bacterium]